MRVKTPDSCSNPIAALDVLAPVEALRYLIIIMVQHLKYSRSSGETSLFLINSTENDKNLHNDIDTRDNRGSTELEPF